MSATIDFRTMPANVPVLCIPRVYSNITEARIRRIFDELDMGSIDHIDLVSKTNEKGEKFNRVYVHYHRWNNSENANNARERLLNGKEIKIIYDEPWFWKVSAYREPNTKQTEEKKTYTNKKVSIQFDSDEKLPESRDNRSIDSRPRYPRRDYEDKRPREHREHREPRREYENRKYENRKQKPEHHDVNKHDVNKAASDEFIENIKVEDDKKQREEKQREEDEKKMKELRVDYGKSAIPPARRGKNKYSKNIVMEEETQSNV